MAAFEPIVAVICPLQKELLAVCAVFDQEPELQTPSEGSPYFRGLINGHKAVAVCLPKSKIGLLPARDCRTWLKTAFPSLRYRFLVGIAGGIPDDKNDVRLGDVVIGTHLFKHDSGKWVPNGLQPVFIIKEAPEELPKMITAAELSQEGEGLDQLIEHQLMNMRNRNSSMTTDWSYPDPENAQDLLFIPDYKCLSPSSDQCSCDQTKTVKRVDRQSHTPKVHYGLIASGDQVMKDGIKRDQLQDNVREFGMDPLAVEMEAAALDDLEYMVIRGICDYADSHKNKKWQEYAAATAAACFKAILHGLPTLDISMPPSPNSTASSEPEMQITQPGPEEPSWTWCLSTYHYQSKTKPQNGSQSGEAAELRLFQEATSKEPLKTARKIVIHDLSQGKDSVVSWLPLDRVEVRLQINVVHLKFSDCNNHAQETVNGPLIHYSVYNATDPNIRTNFNFVDEKAAQEFSNLILHVSCALPGYHQLGAFQTRTGTCSYGSAQESENKPGTNDQVQQDVDIIINIELNDHEHFSISSIFNLRSRIDYNLETGQNVINVGLRQLRKAVYKTPEKTSANWPPHWVRENSSGKPEKVSYHDFADVTISFQAQVDGDRSWKAFMKVITGWQIQHWENAHLHGDHVRMVVWSRESIVRILCKAGIHNSNPRWYCLDLSGEHEKNMVSLARYLGKKTAVNLQQVSFSDGSHIDRSMEVEQAQISRQDKISKQTIKFANKVEAELFEKRIRELLAPSNRRPFDTEPLQGSRSRFLSIFSRNN